MTASAWAEPAQSQAPSASIDEKANLGKAIPLPKIISRTDTTIDPAGKLSSYQPGGATATASNAFFQSLGTNGRSCLSCHSPNDGWSISSADVAARFKKTSGTDPVFRLVDGATCPNDDVLTVAAMQQAYKLLLAQGLIRISLAMPAASSLEFSITSVNDPYNCNSDPEFGLTGPTTGMVSIYRRPLPATNLKFESNLMWDGREPNLASQAAAATTIHAQTSTPPDSAELQQIVDFETGIFTAQAHVQDANLDSGGANGGPDALSTQSFFTGINDPFGRNPNGTAFDPNIFDLFDAWAPAKKGRAGAAKESIERGAQIFNTQTFTIGRSRPQRRSRANLDYRHLRNLPRYSERREPVSCGHDGHRHFQSVADQLERASIAGLYDPMRCRPSGGADFRHARSRTRADYRQV